MSRYRANCRRPPLTPLSPSKKKKGERERDGSRDETTLLAFFLHCRVLLSQRSPDVPSPESSLQHLPGGATGGCGPQEEDGEELKVRERAGKKLTGTAAASAASRRVPKYGSRGLWHGSQTRHLLKHKVFAAVS